ncbi:MAG: hypothetical protein LBI99_10310 [Propionibacteriaceae bacterium]|nr:hypothetical protein [Propionibacteriaceae bacterium]
MNPADQPAEPDYDLLREYLEPVALALADPPMSRMAWRFYAAFFLYQDLAPLTAAQLRELVGTGTASSSVALRELEQNGVITRTRLPEQRADVYDLIEEIQYGRRWARNMKRPQPTLHAALDALPEGSKAWLRINSMIDLGDFLADRMPILMAEWVRERAHLYGR